MSKTASLIHVEPTVVNAFNPKGNNQPQGISVEDVTSFKALLKSTEITPENNVTDVFIILAKKYIP